ncbi:TolC family outer membrane protein [Pontibacter sp. JAM-7]|uniref:TolC family outer membrane protein n=1 Tax=Pontibacter sp. JAM-7 TaxID=3366581 RepID=UPI003AF9847A
MKKNLVLAAILATMSASSIAATLEDVVIQGLNTNPEVQSALSSRNAVYQEVVQARAGYLPTLDFAGGVGWEKTNNTTTRANGFDNVELHRKEASLSLRQMLFDGFATKQEVERQTARADSADQRVVETAERYALEASRAYLEVMRRQELLQQAKETLFSHVRIYDQIKRRSESGLGALASIQQAEGRLALAEVNVLAAENNLVDAQATYQRITGQLPEGEFMMPKLDVSLPETREGAVKYALENHPTLGVAEADTMAAVAQYEASRARWAPRLHLEVDRTWNNDIDGVDGINEDFVAMLRLRYNMYNGGADRARVRQTQHQIEAAKSISADTHRQVVQSVELSWNAQEILARQIPYLQQHVVASEQTRNSYQKQFNIGQRSLLDLLDTENEVFSAKNDLTNALYDHMIAQYRLLNGMGQLLDTMQLVLPEPNLGNVKPEQEQG